MSVPPFEMWAANEAKRLRAEAMAIEQAAARYLAATKGMTATVNAIAPQYPREHDDKRINEDPRARMPSPRTSKYESLFVTWGEASGTAGLTLDDMERLAKDAGISIERNALRSIVFNQKKHGRVNPSGDRYIWQASTTQAGDLL